jgi:hypothetical protein
MTKLRAFSLVETVIVIALTGILVFVCVYAYLIVKTHETRFYAKNEGTTDICLAVEKINELAYKSTVIYFQNPNLIFETDSVLGTVKLEDDSISIQNATGIFFLRIGGGQFKADKMDFSDGSSLITRFSLQLDKINTPLVYKKTYGNDIMLNKSIGLK